MIDAAAHAQACGGDRRRPARPGSGQRPEAARHGRHRGAPDALADGAPARRSRRPTCCRQSLEERGLKFLLEKQTEALIRGQVTNAGRVAALRFKDGLRNSRRPGGDGRRHPPQHGAGRIGRHLLQPRHRGQRHHADLRPAHLRGRRMRRASRHRLRSGGAAVRAGQGLRQPPGQLRHRPLYGLGDFDQAQGHRHRPLFRRRLHGRRGHRRDRAQRPRPAACTRSW